MAKLVKASSGSASVRISASPGGMLSDRSEDGGQDRWWLIALFGGALALRMAHLFSIRHSPLFLYLGLDPLAYHEWGQRLAAGDWLGQRIFYQDPLYPYFLGALYAILGEDRLIVTAIQLLLGSLIPVLIYDATRRTSGATAARIAGVLAACYLPSIYYEGLILKTWLGTFLVTLAVWTMARALTALSGANRWWLLCGVTMGLGCLVRGNLLLVLPVLMAWRILAPVVSGPPPAVPVHWLRRLNVSQAAMLALGMALILFPTALRNRVVGEAWVLTTAQGGQNFYIGNNPANRNGRYDPLPFVGANPKYEEKGFTAEALRRTGRDMHATEISDFWFDESFSWISSHPKDWLSLTWLKFRTYWGAFEVPDNLDYNIYKKDAPILRLPLAGFGLVVPLGLLGAGLSLRREGWNRGLVLLTAVYSISVVLFFVFSRYRLAMMPALFPLAGCAVIELLRRWHQARSQGRFPLGILTAVLLLFAFVHLPVHAHVDSRTFRTAALLHLPRVAESSATGYYNLGLAFAQYAEEEESPEEMLRQAVAQFTIAIAEEPERPEPWAEMGKALARLGEDRRAIEAYTRVIAMEPGKPRPLHVLGILYRRVGDLAAAAEMYRHALRANPQRLDSATALGDVLLAQGLRQEAADAYRHALDLKPDHAPALAGLRRAGIQP